MAAGSTLDALHTCGRLRLAGLPLYPPPCPGTSKVPSPITGFYEIQAHQIFARPDGPGLARESLYNNAFANRAKESRAVKSKGHQAFLPVTLDIVCGFFWISICSVRACMVPVGEYPNTPIDHRCGPLAVPGRLLGRRLGCASEAFFLLTQPVTDGIVGKTP